MSIEATTAEAKTVASGTAYPLATVLRPGRNISMRRTPQERRREILAWLAIGVILAAVIWIVIYLGVSAR